LSVTPAALSSLFIDAADLGTAPSSQNATLDPRCRVMESGANPVGYHTRLRLDAEKKTPQPSGVLLPVL